MTTLEVLQKARGFVERGWCQGAFARRADGGSTLSMSSDATQWCMLGAINAAACGAHYAVSALEKAISAQARSHEDHAVQLFNDAPGRTQSEVLAAFDAAIASLTNNC